MAKDKLNPKQQAFADAIVAGMNPSKPTGRPGAAAPACPPRRLPSRHSASSSTPISLIVEEGRKAAAEAARWTLALATRGRMRIVNDKAIEEIEQLGFVKKSPAYGP
ncbi:MAG: hypothetical protein V8S24_07220 [Gordonibacter pamelaeae]